MSLIPRSGAETVNAGVIAGDRPVHGSKKRQRQGTGDPRGVARDREHLSCWAGQGVPWLKARQ